MKHLHCASLLAGAALCTILWACTTVPPATGTPDLLDTSWHTEGTDEGSIAVLCITNRSQETVYYFDRDAGEGRLPAFRLSYWGGDEGWCAIPIRAAAERWLRHLDPQHSVSFPVEVPPAFADEDCRLDLAFYDATGAEDLARLFSPLPGYPRRR